MSSQPAREPGAEKRDAGTYVQRASDAARTEVAVASGIQLLKQLFGDPQVRKALSDSEVLPPIVEGILGPGFVPSSVEELEEYVQRAAVTTAEAYGVDFLAKRLIPERVRLPSGIRGALKNLEQSGDHLGTREGRRKAAERIRVAGRDRGPALRSVTKNLSRLMKGPLGKAIHRSAGPALSRVPYAGPALRLGFDVAWAVAFGDPDEIFGRPNWLAQQAVVSATEPIDSTHGLVAGYLDLKKDLIGRLPGPVGGVAYQVVPNFPLPFSTPMLEGTRAGMNRVLGVRDEVLDLLDREAPVPLKGTYAHELTPTWQKRAESHGIDIEPGPGKWNPLQDRTQHPLATVPDYTRRDNLPKWNPHQDKTQDPYATHAYPAPPKKPWRPLQDRPAGPNAVRSQRTAVRPSRRGAGKRASRRGYEAKVKGG